MIVVNKADGDAELLASQSMMHYKNAMGFLNHQSFWTPEVLSVSSIEPRGIDTLWERMVAYCEAGSGAIPARRASQTDQWFERLLNDDLAILLRSDASWAQTYNLQKTLVAKGEITPTQGALICLEAVIKKLNHSG